MKFLKKAKQKQPVEPLEPITLILGTENEGVLSNAVYLTRNLAGKTTVLDFLIPTPGLDEGIIPNHLLKADLQAIILTNVKFKLHTQRVKKIVNQITFDFIKPGTTEPVKMARPPILICTSTEFSKIPMEIFPDVRPGNIAVLNCRFDQK